MKTFVAGFLTAVAAAAFAMSTDIAAAGEVAEKDRLVVHEWGTFTNFSGSDGVKLDFRPLVDNDLPHFVLDRAWQAGIVQPFVKARVIGRQRMETPVTYFYTEEVREVNVRVGFPKGLLTEFYPPVQKMLPEFTVDQFRTPAAPGNSVLDWGKVTLIPESQFTTNIEAGDVADRVNTEIMNRLIPGVGHSPHYGYARETDSAVVHVRNKADSRRPRMPSGNFFEKFLFYRGVGSFRLPLHLESPGDGQFVLTNKGTAPVGSLFLVTVRSGEIQFQAYDKVKAGESLRLTQSNEAAQMDVLCQDVADTLVASGLYLKEARAMVNTWRDSWFGEEGTRLFYIVPSGLTEELLPLQVTPKPDETVRVLVGRMEIMTPEDEMRIQKLVRQSIEQRQQYAVQAAELQKAKKPVPPYKIPGEILGMGRLAEPALVRVIGISDDIAVRREGRLLLKQWHQQLGIDVAVSQTN